MMTKSFFSLISMCLVLLGASSCEKTIQTTDINGADKGTLAINFGFQETPVSKAAISTATPITTWTHNVKSLNILFVKNGNIVDNRSISVPTGNDNTMKSSLLAGIPTGNYEIYLIANLGQTANPFTAAAGSSASPAVAPGMSGPISSLLINLATAGAVAGQTEVAGSTTYREPSEIFMANTTATITADVTTTATLTLTRMVSLMRVRVNQDGGYAQNKTLVSFTDAAAALRIRRHGVSLNASTGVVNPVTRDVQDVLLSNKVFQNADPSTGYGAGGSMNLTGGFTLWNDYMILPGGSATTSASKFNIVLTGKAQEGYIGLDQNGATAAAVGAGGAMVHWTGAISEVVAANGILEVNITLNSPGIVDANVPETVDYGKLQVEVSLANWGIISSTDLPL